MRLVVRVFSQKCVPVKWNINIQNFSAMGQLFGYVLTVASNWGVPRLKAKNHKWVESRVHGYYK